MTSAPAAVGSLVAGFVVGMLAVSAVARWLAAVMAILREAPTSAGKVPRLAIASLLSSGPWVFGLLATAAYLMRHEPWAPWVYGGFLGAIALMVGITLHVSRSIARSRDAAVRTPDELGPVKGPGLVFSAVLGLLVGSAVLYLSFPDAPAIVWLIALPLSVVFSVLMNSLFGAMFNPKPWVAPRKGSSSE